MHITQQKKLDKIYNDSLKQLFLMKNSQYYKYFFKRIHAIKEFEKSSEEMIRYFINNWEYYTYTFFYDSNYYDSEEEFYLEKLGMTSCLIGLLQADTNKTMNLYKENLDFLILNCGWAVINIPNKILFYLGTNEFLDHLKNSYVFPEDALDNVIDFVNKKSENHTILSEQLKKEVSNEFLPKKILQLRK